MELVTRREAENLASNASQLLEAVRKWQAAILSEGRESDRAKSLRQIAWTAACNACTVFSWKAWSSNYPGYWTYFEEENPGIAGAMLDLDAALDEVKPHVSWEEWNGDGTKFPWIPECERALKRLNKALAKGVEESWLPSSEAAACTGLLGRKLTPTTIKRQAERGCYPGREAADGADHQFEVEVGSFFRWFVQEHRSEIRRKAEESRDRSQGGR